jgi:hypothetical protein
MDLPDHGGRGGILHDSALPFIPFLVRRQPLYGLDARSYGARTVQPVLGWRRAQQREQPCHGVPADLSGVWNLDEKFGVALPAFVPHQPATLRLQAPIGIHRVQAAGMHTDECGIQRPRAGDPESLFMRFPRGKPAASLDILGKRRGGGREEFGQTRLQHGERHLQHVAAAVERLRQILAPGIGPLRRQPALVKKRRQACGRHEFVERLTGKARAREIHVVIQREALSETTGSGDHQQPIQVLRKTLAERWDGPAQTTGNVVGEVHPHELPHLRKEVDLLMDAARDIPHALESGIRRGIEMWAAAKRGLRPVEVRRRASEGFPDAVPDYGHFGRGGSIRLLQIGLHDGLPPFEAKGIAQLLEGLLNNGTGLRVRFEFAEHIPPAAGFQSSPPYQIHTATNRHGGVVEYDRVNEKHQAHTAPGHRHSGGQFGEDSERLVARQKVRERRGTRGLIRARA